MSSNNGSCSLPHVPCTKKGFIRTKTNCRPFQFEQNIKNNSFRLLTVQQVRNSLPPNSWVISLDLKDVYWHVPIAPRFQRYLSIRLDNKTFCFLPVTLRTQHCPEGIYKASPSRSPSITKAGHSDLIIPRRLDYCGRLRKPVQEHDLASNPAHHKIGFQDQCTQVQTGTVSKLRMVRTGMEHNRPDCSSLPIQHQTHPTSPFPFLLPKISDEERLGASNGFTQLGSNSCSSGETQTTPTLSPGKPSFSGFEPESASAISLKLRIHKAIKFLEKAKHSELFSTMDSTSSNNLGNFRCIESSGLGIPILQGPPESRSLVRNRESPHKLQGIVGSPVFPYGSRRGTSRRISSFSYGQHQCSGLSYSTRLDTFTPTPTSIREETVPCSQVQDFSDCTLPTRELQPVGRLAVERSIH